MASNAQTNLSTWEVGKTTETVTQTVKLPLETSNAKNRKVKQACDEFQKMCSTLADHMPSVGVHGWNQTNPALYRIITREHPKDERAVGAKVALAATNHVSAAFQSHKERGGERPEFSGSSYFYLDNQQLTLEKSDGNYGLKANFIPYNPVWWRIKDTAYNREYLERIVSSDGKMGTAVFRYEEESGAVACHLPVSWDVEVYAAEGTTTAVGVDIGESVIYAASVIGPDGVKDVKMQSGKEFRHYRERLKEKRKCLSEKGDLRGVRKCRGDIERYTEQILHTASREIVDLAVEHRPATVVLEELTGYRETGRDRIHDWPYAMLQEQIAYKATAEGIPVKFVEPAYTSVTCRKCGQQNEDFRDGPDFHCTRCGYEVHADVNAAINIAKRI